MAQDQELRVYDLDGVLLRAITLDKKEHLSDLAFDRLYDQVWVALKDRLRRYNADGVATFDAAGQFDGAIVADGAGGLWLARDRSLAHISESGAVDFSLEPFTATTLDITAIPDQSIVDLAADPQNFSIWVASQRRIKHYAIDGELLHELKPEMNDGVIRRLYRASLYADLDPPEIEISAPANGSLLNHNRPAFELQYLDLGVGVDPSSIKLKSADQILEVTCDADSAQALCTLGAGLPEGEQLITATVADYAGNVSKPAEVRLTIDTVPPQITVDFPPENHITNQPALTLRGSLNEPATLTINDSPVSLDSSHRFAHDAQLQEGPNIFNLRPTDLAGNNSTLSLSVTLDTTPPATPEASRISVSEVQDGQVSVVGQAGAVEPRARVRVTNLRTGESVEVTASQDGSFTAVINAEPGDELSITAYDAAGNASAAAPAQVPVALNLKVTEPVNGTSIQGDFVAVAGELKAPPNTGVVVNDKVAAVVPGSPISRFYVRVPLQAGSNSLTVVATLQDGRTLNETLSVTRSGPFPYDVNVNFDSGLAPLDVVYSVTDPKSYGMRQFFIDFDGNGTWDFSSYSPRTDVKRSYTSPGVYRAKIRVLDQFSIKHEVVIPIVVLDKGQLDQLLRAVWAKLNSDLIRGDVQSALKIITFDSRQVYAEVLQSLLPHMSDILDDFTHIEPMALTDVYADYVVMNVRNEEARVHVINFTQDADGVWRIESM